MKLKDIGPAIIVAAVVLGPGSILVSSKVGSEFGVLGLAVLVAAGVLMFGMVSMAARIGVVFEGTPGEEITARLGKLPSLIVGLALFGIVAIFQSSNNIAVIAGLEEMFAGPGGFESTTLKLSILLAINAAVLAALFLAGDLYKQVERLMKVLVLVMLVAFVVNFAFVILNPPSHNDVTPAAVADVPLPSESGEGTQSADYMLLVGLVATTFSVAGAYYQAYLVREKKWTAVELRQGLFDSMFGVTILCLMSGVILTTSALMFFGHEGSAGLTSVGAIAGQLEPVFGKSAKIIFAVGILAGAFSSFLINAIIGGTIFSDSIGRGAKLSERWPRYLTALALVVGLIGGGSSLISSGSTVHLITFAQALTVIGIPALALALLYLGTRPTNKVQSTAEVRPAPKWMIVLVVIGTIVAFALAVNTINKVGKRLWPSQQATLRTPGQNYQFPETLCANGADCNHTLVFAVDARNFVFIREILG